MPHSVACPECGEQTPGLPCTSCGADPHTSDDAALLRDDTADDRDRAAELRDRDAATRDAAARRQEQAGTGQAKVPGNRRSGDDRVADRREQLSATPATDASKEEALLQGEHDRADAAGDRADAAGDRAEAAGDRAEAARDRAEALFESTESALAARRAIEILESMSDAFLSLDAEWRFTYLNPQAETLLGRDRHDLVGKNLWEEYPELVGSAFEMEHRRALREQVPVRFEALVQQLDVTLEVRAYPVVAGLAVYFRDITEERLRDDRLHQGERLEMLGQITAGIVHDFTNLLAATGGYAAMGEADAPDAKIAHYFQEITNANQKAEALTRQLLAFARQQELSPALMDANEVINGLSSLLSQLMPPDIELRLSLAPETVTVFVDRSQLEQVVLNLVVNSRDAIQGKGSITITTASEDPTGIPHDLEGPFGWLQVIDTGTGIPDDIRPRIFDPFFTTKAPGEGTGLGLATIYGIVSQSSGSVFVDSQVGEGTSMTIALPAEPTRATN